MSGPIRVDHVAAYPGGWLGMTFTPGKHDWGMTGKHRRDLVKDVATLRDDVRIDTFVWLIEDHELPMLKVEGLGAALEAARIELVRFPIVDGSVPVHRGAFAEFIADLHARLGRGERVAVACRGGCGRTGTVVGCLLRDIGLDGDAAIMATRAARGCAIENHDQERYVREWDSPAREALR